MYSEENSSGKPLANSSWLENHHRAKIPERTAFAMKLAKLQPKKIVDLGCATGLWLELLNEILPVECEFIGIDSDIESLEIAISRSKTWSRKISFMQLDIEKDAASIPSADLTLAFNIFPYIKDIDKFINILATRTPQGTLAVRQYDGASIRFGPMPTAMRQKIEQDLLKIFPKDYLKDINHLFVWHGRNTCVARKPKCDVCTISHLCKHCKK